ncbi:MAG: 50S ribosomal protein L23 [Alphaproteobacteria bacterium]|nr:50S ribosomal protein L23 [Alphaproteobacteria bacterium]
MKFGFKKKKPQQAVIRNAYYDIIRAPVVTEKSTAASEHNKVTFQVALGADKDQIKAAVEALFGVTVVKVNTLLREGKTKRFRGVPGKRPDVKKAVVTLAAGQSIDVAAGVR